MVHEIPFPSLLDELSSWADYTHRQFHIDKAFRVYRLAVRNGKTELASRILTKYGKAIDRSCRSDIAMAMALTLKAQQK